MKIHRSSVCICGPSDNLPSINTSNCCTTWFAIQLISVATTGAQGMWNLVTISRLGNYRTSSDTNTLSTRGRCYTVLITRKHNRSVSLLGGSPERRASQPVSCQTRTRGPSLFAFRATWLDRQHSRHHPGSKHRVFKTLW